MASLTHDDGLGPYHIATTADADQWSVNRVLGAKEGDDEGRSGWQWLRLPNGDLMLGVFPRGETHFAVETAVERAFTEEDPL